MVDEAEEEFNEWDARKSAMMAAMLGREHDHVMHALIPYEIGGALDLYYFPHGIPGTAIATKELTESPGHGSTNDVFRTYELVMFTKAALDLGSARDDSTAFGRAHDVISAILNSIAPYSAQAKLNPNETCEFPANFPTIGGRCLIFDGYPAYVPSEKAEFGLLAIIEIFRSEMEFARANGGRQLLDLLKARGHYPYSDLDRAPVV